MISALKMAAVDYQYEFEKITIYRAEKSVLFCFKKHDL